MKRIIKLTESDLTKIIRKITESDEFKYGHEKINKLYDKIGDDEDVKLDDSGGDLSGKIVKKIDYVISMLQDASREKDWSKVNNALSYLKIKMK